MCAAAVKVLVLEDDEMVRENLIDYLEDEGFFVIGFVDAESALEQILKDPFQIAIVDMRLPGTDGNSFIIKSCQINKDMKYIIHTGSSNFSLISELATIGINESQVFIKPVKDMRIIVNKINELLGNTTK